MGDGKKWAAEHCMQCGNFLEDCVCRLTRRSKGCKEMNTELKGGLESIGIADARELMLKEREYGSSWRKRGGVGAFMMLARKWDRIENLATEMDYDIFEMWKKNPGDIRDDIGDLRRYLMLVEEFMTREKQVLKSRDEIAAALIPPK